MAYHLDFVPEKFHRLKKTVYLRRHAHSRIEIINIIKAVGRIYGNQTAQVWIIILKCLRCVHTVVKADSGIDIHIFEYIECSRSRSRMPHTVSPVFYQVGFKEQVLFCLDRILKKTAIRETYFFIPAFIPYRIFTLERIYLAH